MCAPRRACSQSDEKVSNLTDQWPVLKKNKTIHEMTRTKLELCEHQLQQQNLLDSLVERFDFAVFG